MKRFRREASVRIRTLLLINKASTKNTSMSHEAFKVINQSYGLLIATIAI